MQVEGLWCCKHHFCLQVVLRTLVRPAAVCAEQTHAQLPQPASAAPGLSTACGSPHIHCHVVLQAAAAAAIQLFREGFTR